MDGYKPIYKVNNFGDAAQPVNAEPNISRQQRINKFKMEFGNPNTWPEASPSVHNNAEIARVRANQQRAALIPPMPTFATRKHPSILFSKKQPTRPLPPLPPLPIEGARRKTRRSLRSLRKRKTHRKRKTLRKRKTRRNRKQ